MNRELEPTMLIDRPDSSRMLWVRYLVLGLLCLAPISAYLTRVMSAINKTLEVDFEIDEVAVGSILGVFNIGYVMCQVPGGWLAQRFSVRSVFPVMAVGWSLSTIWFTTTDSEWGLNAARIVMGMFQAGMVPCCALVIGAWVKEHYRGLYSSLIGIAMQVGGVIATFLTPYLLKGTLSSSISPMPWTEIYRWYAASGIIFAVAFVWIYRDRPSKHPWLKNEGISQSDGANAAGVSPPAESLQVNETVHRLTAMKGLLIMLASTTMWMICLQGFFRAFAYEFFTTWFTRYLEEARQMKLETAGNWATLPMIAFGAGSLAGGVAVDYIYVKTGNKWVSRSLTAAVSMGLCALCTWMAVLVVDDSSAILLISLGAFLASIAGPSTWAACLDVSGKRSALIFGIMNSCGAAGAFLCPVMVGYLFKYIKAHDADWNYILYLFVVVNFAGALSWILLDPSRRIFDDDSAEH
ncbi:MAG: MFS transporter [Planctomycetota bacterium]|nr:MFS transporter [Planctomycetota bacterium]MDA1213837.1 MFS transporter [Planctomycetota bacterium]